MALKIRRSVWIGVPMIVLGLIAYVLENQKTGQVVLPSRTLTLIVPPSAEDAFEQSIRDYAQVNGMALTATVSNTPGFLSVTLDGKRLHINVSRTAPDDRRTTRVYIFAPKRLFGLGPDVAAKTSADFIGTVTKTPGVTLAK